MNTNLPTAQSLDDVLEIKEALDAYGKHRNQDLRLHVFEPMYANARTEDRETIDKLATWGSDPLGDFARTNTYLRTAQPIVAVLTYRAQQAAEEDDQDLSHRLANQAAILSSDIDTMRTQLPVVKEHHLRIARAANALATAASTDPSTAYETAPGTFGNAVQTAAFPDAGEADRSLRLEIDYRSGVNVLRNALTKAGILLNRGDVPLQVLTPLQESAQLERVANSRIYEHEHARHAQAYGLEPATGPSIR